jgi:hypothetical protein
VVRVGNETEMKGLKGEEQEKDLNWESNDERKECERA